MRPTYATTLDLAGDPRRAYTAARALTRHWLAKAVGPWPEHLHPYAFRWSPSPGVTLLGREENLGDRALWRVQLAEPLDDPTLTQLTTVVTATDGHAVLTHVSMGLVAADDRLVDSVHYDIVPPALVGDLVARLDVRDAGVTMTPAARRVASAGALEAVAALVAAPRRRYPLLVIGGRPSHCDPDALAAAVVGLAHVVVVDPALLPAWRRLVPEAPVRDGEVRLVWAGFGARNVWRFPSWQGGAPGGGGRTESTVAQVARRLYAAAAFRVGLPTLVRDIESAALRERSGQLAGAGWAPAAGGESEELLAAWEADLERAERAEAALAEAEGRAAGLAAELEDVRAALAAARPVADLTPPSTPLEAVERAREICAHLEFHPDALATAATCAYQRPDLVLADLVRLDEVLTVWRERGLPGGLVPACREVGLDWRNDVSDTARARYRSDYLHTIDGVERFCGAHLVRGSNAPPTGHVRIHAWVDTEARRIVVVYVGRHLRDATNR